MVSFGCQLDGLGDILEYGVEKSSETFGIGL